MYWSKWIEDRKCLTLKNREIVKLLHFSRCHMERERCLNADPELSTDHDGECIEFEAVEADEEGHSEDTGCSGQHPL